jgi:hypothetical protein
MMLYKREGHGIFRFYFRYIFFNIFSAGKSILAISRMLYRYFRIDNFNWSCLCKIIWISMLLFTTSALAFDTRASLNDNALTTVYINHWSWSNKPSDIYKFIDGNVVCYIVYGNGKERDETISCIKL